MDEGILKIITSVLTAVLLCVSTVKLMGALQQGGYKNGSFWRWLRRKENLQFNRLAVLSLCLALATAVVSLSFSFLGVREALLIAAIPFFGLLLLFWRMDARYALRVPVKFTARLMRLFAVYILFTASAAYILLSGLHFLALWNGSKLYALIAYVPFAVLPMLTPVLLVAANGVIGGFEELHNQKFVKRAGQVLDERQIIRIGVVGSYGKTSVKNILKTILSEKYSVVETPHSYNTPMGIARTVCSPDFDQKQIFIAEMGARKQGDISFLCNMVKPDYAVFTGVCEQHIQGFGSIDGVWSEKSEILKCGAKKVFCGADLKERIEKDFVGAIGKTVIVDDEVVEVNAGAAWTAFQMRIFGETVELKTALLGKMAVENIRLAVLLCIELGMTADEIVRGVEKLQPIPHRLQLMESGGIYILDDGYNCNPKGAEEAIAALCRFSGRKCIVTPGIVECGVLQEKINGELGEKIARAGLDKTILVGHTLVGAVKKGYERAGGVAANLQTVDTLEKAQGILKEFLQEGDAVLFLNDLPDVY